MFFLCFSVEGILATENEKCVKLNVRVRNNTHYVNLTVSYNDGSEDVLYLSSLKATTTFKFYDFNSVEISSGDVKFCLNYRLSNYTIPEIQDPDFTEFKMSDDHLTRQIYQKDFSKTDTESTLCEQFNLYKAEFEKQYDDCDTKQPNKTTEIIRHSECPRYWANSENCQQFTFRVLVSGQVVPEDIIMDDHMKNTLAKTKRYLDEQGLRNFWDSLVGNNAFNEYRRSLLESSSEVMSIVAAIIGILVLGFFIIVAIFRSPVFNDKFSNDTVETTDNEEKQEEIDFTIEMTSPEQVIPDFYGAHLNSAFLMEESTHNNFGESETIFI